METAIASGADFGVKTAAAGALKAASEKGILQIIPKGTKGSVSPTGPKVMPIAPPAAAPFADAAIPATRSRRSGDGACHKGVEWRTG